LIPIGFRYNFLSKLAARIYQKFSESSGGYSLAQPVFQNMLSFGAWTDFAVLSFSATAFIKSNA